MLPDKKPMSRLLNVFVMLPLLWATQLSAQDTSPPWYEVEMIIIKHLYPKQTTEQWSEPESEFDASQFIELIPEQKHDESSSENTPPSETVAVPLPMVESPLPEEQPYQILYNDTYRLNALANRLARSRDYRVLSHIAWRQPFMDKQSATPVHLHSKMNESIDTLMPEEKISFESSEISRPFFSPLSKNTVEPEEEGDTFEGSLKLSVARYLHADINLIFNQKAPEESITASESAAEGHSDTVLVTRFQLDASRRMRSKNLHYIDHPFYGVFLLVTPYEYPVISQ